MKFIKITLVIISLILVLVIGFFWHMGYFESVQVQEKQEGGYLMAGIDVVGPYSDAGRHISKVGYKLKALGINSGNGIGIYYDDPKTTPKDKYHSFVGNIINVTDIDLLEKIKLNGLKIDSIPQKKALIIEFPIKNTMSYMIGPMKAYPIFTQYVLEKNIKPTLTFEIYDMEVNIITFVMQYD
jgi:hypothetical protein